MFKKLHHQMTLFCTMVTGLILVAMSCICLTIAESGIRDISYSSFITNINSLYSYLENQSVITHTWITQMEYNYHIQLDIKDTGNNLVFDSLNPSPAAEKLTAQANETALQTFGLDIDNFGKNSVLSKHEEFKMTGEDGELYYASVALIPKDSGYLSITAISPFTSQKSQIFRQRMLIVLVDLCAIILLGIFSWLFTRHMIRPLKENREKQVQFVASASHELRSPLTVITSSLSALKIAGKEDAIRFIHAMESEAARMARLINDMLTLANADARNWTIQREPTELDTLVLETYEKFEPQALDKNMDFAFHIPEQSIPPLLCDPGRIGQILSILLDNAFSYTPEGGKVSISLAFGSGNFQIAVTDSGLGIADENKKAVFDRFYRVDASHKDKEHFGLGLCIAKEIIKLHKGRIWIEDAPGGGTSIMILLPVTS
ncbi:sensor histidine kinase [Robinsoniella peoriensis]|uniref:sensor histidine kinase n=1 Tax=Robinsoniella peoriensis TaxID=180332 RepID=UPI00085C5486|nr:HAMP domain-containing sensor histidine kinase [Robinsoniella peoriensis]